MKTANNLDLEEIGSVGKRPSNQQIGLRAAIDKPTQYIRNQSSPLAFTSNRELPAIKNVASSLRDSLTVFHRPLERVCCNVTQSVQQNRKLPKVSFSKPPLFVTQIP